METIKNLQLNIDSSVVRQSLISTKIVKLPKECVITKKYIYLYYKLYSSNVIYIYPPKPKGKKALSRGYIRGDDVYFTLKSLKLQIPNVIVQGLSTVSRSILNRVY